MKRIDDKIKEIEKKEKRNNVLFIAFIIVVVAFMGYALQAEKAKKAKDDEINELGQTLEEANDSLQDLNVQLQNTIETLKQSLTPQGFWDDVKKDGSAQAYIDYLTQKKINILHPDEGLEKLKNDAKGTEAWLFCGRMNGSNFNERISKVILRSGTEEDTDISKTKPEIGDILENTSNNRETYRRFGSGNVVQNSKNNPDKAWKRGTRAVVTDVQMGGDAVFIKIKF
ncbi:MAG: hypothetical protein HKO90_02655 [Flavobacteriaceae bacterium]|nr:hypothetical protein [Flavobacteriaceae bacterium]